MMLSGDVRTISAHIAVLVLALGISAGAAPAGEPKHLIVSMVHLLARPSELEGKIVTVQGYLSFGHLFLTKDHAKIADFPSSVPVRGPAELAKCFDAYVHVVGWFALEDDGYAIVKTLEVSRWSDGEVPLATCWKSEE